MNSTNRTYVQPHLVCDVLFWLHRFQLVVGDYGNVHHNIKLGNTGYDIRFGLQVGSALQ